MKNIQKQAIFIAFSWIAALPAMENKQYDLTNPVEVQTWAKSQGIPMPSSKAREFAAQQMAENEFALYSRASSTQKKNWDKYNLTNPMHVVKWAKETKNRTLNPNEAGTFAYEWETRSLNHRATQLEERDLEYAISLSKKEHKPNNNPSSNLGTGTTLEFGKNLVSNKGKVKTEHLDMIERFAKEQGISIKEALALLHEDDADQNTKARSNADEVSEYECPICLEDMNPSDKSIVAISKHCSHKFHPACSAEIKKKFGQCPMCNAKIE